MLRPAALDVEHVEADLAVLAREVGAVVVGRGAEEVRDRGGDVDEASAARDEPVVAHALAGDHERRPGLDDAERAVLAAVAALVFPVVRRRVDHAEVGRGRVVEQLRDRVVREGVGVHGAVGVRIGALVGERRELVGGLIGQRVGALGADALVGRSTGLGLGPRNVTEPSWVRAS